MAARGMNGSVGKAAVKPDGSASVPEMSVQLTEMRHHARKSLAIGEPERSMVTACIRIGGVPLVHPPGHSRAGEIVEFSVAVPGRYSLEFRAAPYFVRYHVDLDEDGRARLRLVEKSLPDDCGLTELERELLDGLTRIIARDMLRQREVA